MTDSSEKLRELMARAEQAKSLKAFDYLVYTGMICLAGFDRERWLTDSTSISADLSQLLEDNGSSVKFTMQQHLFGLERMVYSGVWGACGFPTVDVHDKQAAGFMAMDISEADPDTIRSPWSAFMIRLNSDLITLYGDIVVKLIRVRKIGSAWRIGLEPEGDYDGAILTFATGQQLCDESIEEINKHCADKQGRGYRGFHQALGSCGYHGKASGGWSVSEPVFQGQHGWQDG